MPFYTYRAEDGSEVEKMFSMQNRPDKIKEDEKLYERVEEFGTTFHLKGSGWASKGTATAPAVKHGKEIGIAVDHDKKREVDGERHKKKRGLPLP
jgi:hypothetical protein